MSKESLVTVCLQTCDATRRDEEACRFTFDLHTERVKPKKIMLGSLEFPIVQYSIESRWSRLYFCEGLRVLSTSRAFAVHEGAYARGGALLATRECALAVPLHLNPIVEVRVEGARAVVTCMHDHALWHGGLCALPLLRQAGMECQLLHSATGAASLGDGDGVELVSARAFALPSRCVGAPVAHGFLHCTPPPSPALLCALLDGLLQLAQGELDGRYTLAFDEARCAVRLSLVEFGAADVLVARPRGDALCGRLGFSGSRELRARRGSGHVSGLATVSAADVGDALPVALESQAFGGFDYVEIPVGWYIPAHRPMATGQPLRLPGELEGRLNRFAFPPTAEAPTVCVVFRDPSGRTAAAHAPAGLYNALTAAAALEDALNEAASEGTRFEFAFDRCAERFTVRCARHGAAAPFDLLFAHPRCVDAERFGFERVEYAGHAEYTSAAVHVPRLEWPRANWCEPTDAPEPAPSSAAAFPVNLYTVGEVGSTKRLRIGAASKPSLVGRVLGYDGGTRVLTLETHASGVPFAHGAQPGDVLTFVELERAAKLGERESAPCALGAARPVRAVAVVAAAAAATARAAPNTLAAYVPDHGWACAEGAVLGVELCRAPFNLCLLEDFERSIGGRRIGFPNRVIQWGADGSIVADGRRIAPFVAPFVHALDHPDYVLMYVEGGKQSTTLQHRKGCSVSHPFAKIVLYPLFREERMLPREVSLSSGESFTQLTVRFANPDETPYHFHGADFSFSLNLIVSQ